MAKVIKTTSPYILFKIQNFKARFHQHYRYISFKIALATHLYDQEAPDTIYSDYLIMEDKRSQLMLMYQIKGVQGIEIVRFMTFCTRRKACISLTQSSRTLTNSTKKFLRLKGTLGDAYVRWL